MGFLGTQWQITIPIQIANAAWVKNSLPRLLTELMVTGVGIKRQDDSTPEPEPEVKVVTETKYVYVCGFPDCDFRTSAKAGVAIHRKKHARPTIRVTA